MNSMKITEDTAFTAAENDQVSRPEFSVDADVKPTSSGIPDGHPLPDMRECGSTSKLRNEGTKHDTALQIANLDANTKKECHFTFTINVDLRKLNHSVFTAYGQPNESIFSALKANENFQKVNIHSNKNIFVYYKDKEIDGYVNLGMPLKCLPPNSHLEVMFRQRKKSQKEDDQILRHCENPDVKCIVFHVVAVGTTIKSILKVKDLHDTGSTLCVYALAGETIQEAMYKDGRFRSDLNDLEWTIKEGHKINHGKESLVDKVSGKVLQIDISKRKSVRKRIRNNLQRQNGNITGKINPCSLTKSKSEVQDSERSREAEEREYGRHDMERKKQPTMSKIIYPCDSLPNDRKLNSQHWPSPSLCRCYDSNEDATSHWLKNIKTLNNVMQQYPNFNEVSYLLAKCFQEEQKSRNLSAVDLFNVYKEAFAKETGNSKSIKTCGCLTNRSKSVGFIQGNYGSTVNGTCFHLKDGYILSCLHVVKLIVGEGTHPSLWPNIISEHVKVTFNYKVFYPPNPDWFSLASWCELYDGNLDYCVLKLNENANGFPPTLCGLIDPQPTSGLIYLIGHPEGHVKKIDDCTVIPVNERFARYLKHAVGPEEIPVAPCNSYPMFTHRSFQSDIWSADTLSYDTYFSSGSSGSPVFTESGRLVAMHACGHFYTHAGTHYPLIEYGYSMVSIMHDIKLKNESFFNFLFAEKNASHNEEINKKQDSSPRDHQIEPMKLS